MIMKLPCILVLTQERVSWLLLLLLFDDGFFGLKESLCDLSVVIGPLSKTNCSPRV